MTTKEAIILQKQIEKEAIAHIRVAACECDTRQYQDSIRHIQTAWKTPPETAIQSITNILMEAQGNQVYPESELPFEESPLDILNAMLGLVDTALKVKHPTQCRDLLCVALDLCSLQYLGSKVELITTDE